MRITLVAAAAVLLVACGGGSGDSTRTLTGTFTLADKDGVVGPWDDCHGDGGFADFRPGMDVTVRDGNGTIVGTTRTIGLTSSDRESAELGAVAKTAASATRRTCTVRFVAEVKDAEFYSVSAGKRGDLTYSRADLEGMGWHVDLTLGG